MDFKEYVEQHRSEIYKTICKYVPIKDPKEHYSIMRDYIDRQGAYRRPGLVMLAGQMFGAKPQDLILPAAAEQLSEDWILLQDDSEDDSDMRRGKPAAQKLYGWIHSINASDSGHIAMWRILKDYMLKVGPEKGNRMYEKFYDMLTYTVEGQYVENKFIHNTKDLKSGSEELYYRIVDSKTCYYTLYGPMQLGAIAANQGDDVLEMLKAIGSPAGKTFQITDDILDFAGDEKKTGKRPLGDLYEGKLTLIVLHAYKSATAAEKKRMDEIYKKDRSEKTDAEIKFIVDLVNKYGGIDYAKSQAMKFAAESQANLKKYLPKLPKNEYSAMLLSMITDTYARTK